jgi:hypothetical protein
VRRRVGEGGTGGGRRRSRTAHYAGGRGARRQSIGGRGAGRKKGKRIEPGTVLQNQRNTRTLLKRAYNF